MNFYDDIDKYSDNVAIISENGKEFTYQQLLQKADRIGEALQKRDLVFAICQNNFESVAGYIGALRKKAVICLLQNGIDRELLENLVNQYKPNFIFHPNASKPFSLESDVVFSDSTYSLVKTRFECHHEIDPSLALLLTTSGSTGSQKFVRQSYENISSNAESIAQYLNISSDDRPIATMPMSYTFMLSIINSHFLRGSSVIMTEATLMEKKFWTQIKQYQATTFSGVPYIYEMLKKLRFEQMDLPHLRILTQAGGKLNKEIIAEFNQICKSKNMKFIVMYGQTEATARMSYLPWEFAEQKLGSMGIAIPGGQFWLEDMDHNKIEENHISGELIYRGKNVTLGYAQCIADLAKGDENGGILYTGDMAMRDEDGYYYITGRLKRFLKMYGKRVNLDEVEQLLKTKGYDCACAGIDDNLVIYFTDIVDKTKVLKYISTKTGINIAGFKVKVLDAIPRNSSGKVQYSELK